jgi:uncharacterized repeat protein (TIGR01451 family)
MKSFTAHLKRVSLAVVALSSMTVMYSANAAVGETTAGTDITNIATVNYQVGGIAQTAVNSPTASFKVDRKVIFTVSERSGGNTPVSPGQNNAITAFNVSNTGNGPEDFQLAVINTVGGTAFGNTDNSQMNNLRIFVDSNGNNTYDAGVDTATFVNTLARDTSVTVFVLADTPATATNSQFANVQLTARAAVAGSAGATLETESASDTVGVQDVVIADAGRDNSEAAIDQYAVVSASLAVVKTSLVLADPINCLTGVGSCGANVPKAIPGATVEYTIVVTNSGAANATSVALTDNIPTNTQYVAGSMRIGATAATATTVLTDGVDADAGNTTGSPTVTSITVNAGTISSGGGTSAVKFRVTVN